MMKKFFKLACVALASVALFSCKTPTTNIDVENDREGAVMGLDYRDFQRASAKLVDSMLETPALTKQGGGQYVMAVSSIKNDSLQRIDTDQLTKKIRSSLLKSGKVIVTTAVSANGAEDQMNFDARKLRGNDEFDQSTVQKKGTLQAPDLSLSGRILQKNITLDDGRQQAEYYFQMTITNLKSGLAIWEDEEFIGKRGDARAASW